MRIYFRFSILIVGLLIILKSTAQPPANYYNATIGLTGQPLKIKLHDIISAGFISNTYADLWTIYQTTDSKNGKVWDMYSDIPGGTAPYLFTFITDQCGTYSGEGPIAGCYNREHTVPQSWFSSASPMVSDLYHVVPTDGHVNGKRSNYPYGDVTSASWTSLNGSKLGTSAVTGYTGTVFEPIDSFKGDFARIYFYMATRYKDEIPSWTGEPFSAGDLIAWAKNMFLQWNALDPVSEKERQRNNTGYSFQHNRNPYVDHPEWITSVWGPAAGINNVENNISVSIYPNPTSSSIHISINTNINKSYELSLFKSDGANIFTKFNNSKEEEIDFSGLPDGVYFVKLKNDNFSKVEKIVILK
jgi:endonuclease I